MSRPLGIPLGVDFSQLDRDLQAVADRIQAVGKNLSIPVSQAGGGGAGAGPQAASSAVDTSALSASFDRVGSQLSTSISSGLARSSQSMVGFLASMNAMLDRLTGVSIAAFDRIDHAIRFPAFDRFLTQAAEKVRSFGGRVGSALAVPIEVFRGYERIKSFLSSFGGVAGKTFSGMFGSIKLPVIGDIFGGGTKRASEFDATLKASTTSAQQLGVAVRSVGASLLAAFGIVGVLYKTVSFFRDGVKGASDLNEAASRSKVVFGDSFGQVEAQAKRMAVAFGVSRKSQLDVAAGFGAMAQGAGFTESASASLANQLTKMAADLSSSVNLPFQEAGEKIRAALAGQAEPLRQFGVNITEEAVKAYALSAGLAKSANAIDEQAKISARAALIMRGLSYAQNDLERTAGSAANQFRKAGGGLQEFGIRIGELMLPAINAGAQAFNEFLAVVLEVFEGSLPTLKGWFEYLSGAMDAVGVVARNFGAVWEDTQLRVGAFVANAVAWFETIPANFGPITEWLGRNWYQLLADFASMTASAFTNLLSNAQSFGVALWEAIKGNGFEFTWTPLLEGFKATTEQLPELIKPALVNVDDQVAQIWDKVAAKEGDRLAAIASAGKGGTPGKPGPVAAEAKAAEPKLASAVEVGSKEASSIVARAFNQGGRGDVARQGVEVARDSNVTLKNIERKLDRSAMAIEVR